MIQISSPVTNAILSVLPGMGTAVAVAVGYSCVAVGGGRVAVGGWDVEVISIMISIDAGVTVSAGNN